MTDIPTAYVPSKPKPVESREQLRARIPGWGADLDPADRPSVPRLQLHEDLTGAHWDFPDRQPGHERRERSMEHAFVTPVFGTAQPLHGVSGAIRRHAYKKYSEGRAAHWLLLMAGDRVDAFGAHLRSFASLRPDVPATGLKTELTHDGIRSRLGRSRTDTVHQPLDPLIAVGPWVAAFGAAYVGAKAVRKRVRE